MSLGSVGKTIAAMIETALHTTASLTAALIIAYAAALGTSFCIGVIDGIKLAISEVWGNNGSA